MLDKDYKGFVAVARKSLDKVPVDADDIHHDQNQFSYYVLCYQLFTNISKLQRAKTIQNDESVVEVPHEPTATQQQQQSSSVSCNQRKSARTSSMKSNQAASQTNSIQILSSNILPKVCIICKKSGYHFCKRQQVEKTNQTRTITGTNS